MTVVCAKCKKQRIGGRWIKTPLPPAGPVTHGYCPKCLAQAACEIFSVQASEVNCESAETLRGVLSMA